MFPAGPQVDMLGNMITGPQLFDKNLLSQRGEEPDAAEPSMTERTGWTGGREGYRQLRRLAKELIEGADHLLNLGEGQGGIAAQESAVAYLHESGGEHVLEKAPDELEGIESHDAPLTAMGVLVLEGDGVVFAA